MLARTSAFRSASEVWTKKSKSESICFWLKSGAISPSARATPHRAAKWSGGDSDLMRPKSSRIGGGICGNGLHGGEEIKTHEKQEGTPIGVLGILCAVFSPLQLNTLEVEEAEC